MAKVKSKDLLVLVEKAFLAVDFNTHYEMFEKLPGSKSQAVNHLRAMIGDQLLKELKKDFRAYLNEEPN